MSISVNDSAVRFFLDDNPTLGMPVERPTPRGAADSRLAAARATLRETQQAEWEERQRVVRARDGLTAAHTALLQTRQAQAQAAQAVVEDLRRRAAWLRQAISLGEEAVATQRRVVDRLRRELAEIGE